MSELKEYRNNHESTNFITGMRGYSALAVFLIHSGGAGLRELGYFGNEIVDKGKYGVISFFVISAFTIAMSLDKSMKKKIYSFSSYITNRFFRIFPLFFLVGLFAFLTGGSIYYADMFNVQNNINNFLSEISLLNVFFVKHKNNLIGVEWSISLEFFYYLIFPILFLLLRKSSLLLLTILELTYLISTNSLDIIKGLFYSEWAIEWVNSSEFIKQLYLELLNPNYVQIGNHWGILKYLFTFTCGIVAYMLYTSDLIKISYAKLNNGLKSILFLSVLGGGMYFIIAYAHINIEILITGYVVLLLMACSTRDFFVRIIFENPVIMYLGTISYSFYLTHLLVLKYIAMPTLFLQFVVGIVGTILISSLTYYFIEKPGIRFGRFINLKYFSK